MAVIQGLEIRDTGGDQIAVITEYYEGEWSQGVNIADELRFVVPTEGAPDSLVHFNEVWLRRGDDAELVRKFVISDIIYREGHRDEMEIICYDYLSLLSRVEVTQVPDPSLKDGNVNVLAYLSELLALQSDITWGTLPPIASDLEYPYDSLYVANTRVLPSLHRLREYIGGMLWVDNDKKLHWYTKRFPVPPASYSLELGRNLISVKKRDNRLHAGVEGSISYEVEVVDLSQYTGEDDGMLNIGMPVTLNEETLYITDIRQKLSNPLRVTVGVSTTLQWSGRPPDVLDALTTLFYDSLEGQRRDALSDFRFSDLYSEIDDVNARVEENDTELADHEIRIDDLETGTSLPYGEFGDIQPVGGIDGAPYEGDIAQPARVDHIHTSYGYDAQMTEVMELPAIPTYGYREVIWLSAGGGNDKVWGANHYDTRWYPVQGCYTTLSGEV